MDTRELANRKKRATEKRTRSYLFTAQNFNRDRRRRLEQRNHAEAPVVVGEFEAAEPSLPELGADGTADAVIVSQESITQQNRVSDVQGNWWTTCRPWPHAIGRP